MGDLRIFANGPIFTTIHDNRFVMRPGTVITKVESTRNWGYRANLQPDERFPIAIPDHALWPDRQVIPVTPTEGDAVTFVTERTEEERNAAAPVDRHSHVMDACVIHVLAEDPASHLYPSWSGNADLSAMHFDEAQLKQWLERLPDLGALLVPVLPGFHLESSGSWISRRAHPHLNDARVRRPDRDQPGRRRAKSSRQVADARSAIRHAAATAPSWHRHDRLPRRGRQG